MALNKKKSSATTLAGISLPLPNGIFGTNSAPKTHTTTVKHGGGKVMLWGSFSSDVTRPFVKVDEILNSAKTF